jgi:hypothetical protein
LAAGLVGSTHLVLAPPPEAMVASKKSEMERELRMFTRVSSACWLLMADLL